MRRAALVLTLLGAAAGAAQAHPFDVYPAQYEVIARAGQQPPLDLLAATTYGLVLSHDGGATWRWVCEAGFGVVDSWAPEYEYLASGRITATSAGGLYTSEDGCTWMAAGGMGGLDVASTTAVGGDGTLWLGSGTGPAVVLRSGDGGATWDTTGSLGASAIWVESIAVAPSDAMRVYVTGATFVGAVRQARMWRSDDGGTSWTSLPTTALSPDDTTEFQFVAVAGADPDLVFLRRITANVAGDVLFRSVDAGATWTEVLRPDDSIPGVAVRADGSVLAATSGSGMFRAAGVTAAFALLPGPALDAGCLTELSDGQLWVCADNFRNEKMGLGRSTDGAAWTYVMTMLDLAGPVDCAPGTIQRDDCGGTWCAYKGTYGIPSEAVTCQTTDAGIVAEPEPTCLGCGATGGAAGDRTALTWLAGAFATLLAATRRRRRRLHAAGVDS